MVQPAGKALQALTVLKAHKAQRVQIPRFQDPRVR
jgi:hypothetical protein